ncbi:choline/ethanolamine kinase-like isoform X1 [Branchiostoma floridae x Branchiostoma belcheri]
MLMRHVGKFLEKSVYCGCVLQRWGDWQVYGKYRCPGLSFQQARSTVRYKMAENNNGLDPAFHTKAWTICYDYLGPPWKEVPEKEFIVETLPGGLSNYLYVCTLPEKYAVKGVPRKVLLRIYGEILSDVPTVIQDSVIYSILSEKKLAPQLRGIFDGGRLEEFKESRTLTTADLPNPTLSAIIGRKMARLHKLEMPLCKEPKWLIDHLKSYLSNVLNNVSFKEESKAKQLKQLLSYDLDAELQFILRLIEDTHSPVVFCHNDLQEGNILVDDKNGVAPTDDRVTVIDYEYSAYNYRGFDFANHFCEWAMDYNHPKWPYFTIDPAAWPSRKQQLHFLDAYLSESSETSADRDAILREVERFALVSHYWWSLWAIAQAYVSHINFGFLEYALGRFDWYFQMKKNLTCNRKHAGL